MNLYLVCVLIHLVYSCETNASNDHHDGKIASTSPGVCFYGEEAINIIQAVKKHKEEILCKANCHSGKPKDCGEIPKNCKNGIYKIYPKYSPGFNAYCEMDIDGGGWTVFQRRENGAVNFIKGWQHYKRGFGKLDHEFWLGNVHLHRLTSQGRYQLRVDLQDFDGNTAYAVYRHFLIGNERSKFRISVNGYHGTAGDSLGFQNGMAFTTKDNDNDHAGDNCAIRHPGAWWYKNCMRSNLNGEYFFKVPNKEWKGVHWNTWKGHMYSLKASTMMIRKL